MIVKERELPIEVPTYSLTGDVLSFDECGLQYRYQKRAGLRPSQPVQQWFGRFLHAAMDSLYRKWRDGLLSMPLSSSDSEIRSTVDEVEHALRAERLPRPANLGSLPDDRLAACVNILGPMLFPQIKETEVRLAGARAAEVTGSPRLYRMEGIVDVIAAIERIRRIADAVSDAGIAFTSDDEVVLDYKGRVRPADLGRLETAMEWQVIVYSWLRQVRAGSRVVAGVLLFLNEIHPSQTDMTEIQRQVGMGIPPDPDQADRRVILNWRPRQSPPPLSEEFRLRRAMVVIPIERHLRELGLRRFDDLVGRIMSADEQEMGGVPLTQAWPPTPRETTCAICDERTRCPRPWGHSSNPQGIAPGIP